MAEGEIKYRVSADADQAQRELKKTSQRTERLAKVTDRAGDVAQRSARQQQKLARVYDRTGRSAKGARRESDRFGQAIGNAKGQVLALVGGLAGAEGLSRALEVTKQEMRENAQAAREFGDAALNLQFLSQQFSQQERDFVQQAAVTAGRQPAETARAFAQLKSRKPNVSAGKQTALFSQITETARTTDAPLNSLVDAFVTIQKQGQVDAATAQNILRQSIIQAGVSDPAKLSPLFGKSMKIAQEIGGLTAGEAAGAVAGVTSVGLRPEEAATGLKTVLFGLTGEGTSRGKEILQRENIDRGNLVTALQQVSRKLQTGEIKKEELESIAGREGASVLTAITDPEALPKFIASVRKVGQAQRMDRDLTREAIRQQFGADPLQRLNFAQKQAEAAIRNEQISDRESQRDVLLQKLVEKELRERDINAVRRTAIGFLLSSAQAVGLEGQGALIPAAFGSGTIDPAVDEAFSEAQQQVEAVSSGRQVTINNIAQQFNGAGDPSTDDLPQAEQGQRPD